MTLTELLTNIANAIRRKDGTTGSIPAEDFPERIEAIDTAVAPTISVSSSGLITATSGSKSTTKQLSTQAGKTVTPSTSSQTAVSSGRYTTGTVTVAGDSNLKAENIKSGVSIFGVNGVLTSSEKKIVNVTGISYYDENNDILKLSLDQSLTKLDALYVSSIEADASVSLDDLIGDQADSQEQPAYYLWIKNSDMAIHISASPYRSVFKEQCEDGLVTYTLRGNYITAAMNNDRIGFPWPENLRFIHGFAIGE